MSRIEIEARAPLSPEQRERLLAHMQTLGRVQQVSRVMIDFSGPNRERTVALRINDGVQELVAKTGGLAAGVRQEASPLLAPDVSLKEALSYLAIMGYVNGMVSRREVRSVSAEGLEYSMRDVIAPDTGMRAATIVEVEALNVAEGQEQTASARVHSALLAQELQPFDADQWAKWVHDIYERVDRPFINTPANASALAASLATQTAGFLE